MAKPEYTPPNGWDRYSILAEIHRQGMTCTQLAKNAGITLKTFSQVWTRANRKAEKAIADFLCLEPETLWPDRYPIQTARILSNKFAKPDARQKDSTLPDKKAA